MRISWCLVSLLTIADAASAQARRNATASRNTTSQACAKVGAAAQAYLNKNPGEVAPQFPAQLAFDCLQSVPNKPKPAVDLIKSLKAFWQWQSTLAFLKDPPKSYKLPPTDIEAGLSNISSTAAAGGFKSEYDFQHSIEDLILSAHDGHFGYQPDIFKVFVFRNNLASDLVSVSKDGKALPKLYNLADVNATGAIKTAPAITKINGHDATQFIVDLNLRTSSFQDSDSQWNSVFPTYANPFAILPIAASFAFHGANVTLTYENGTEKTEESFSRFRLGVDFKGVNTGEDFYNRFCNPNTQAAGNDSGSTGPTKPPKTKAPPPKIEGYPLPVVRDSGADATSGYFLNGTGYSDVAVLAISAFSPENPDVDISTLDYLTNFQSTVASFLAKCNAAGKKKLVIDLQGNGGGLVIAGHELFAQLYPTVLRFQADNLRATQSLVDMATILSGNVSTNTQAQKEAVAALGSSVIIENLLVEDVVTPQGHAFTSEQQLLGPVTIKGDNFTAFQQTIFNSTGSDFNLTGTGTRSKPPPAVFLPENIVLLTDGTCGSTCTIFSYMMILLANVKTTVVGGRPHNGTMQSIAGVEGAQVFSLSDLAISAAATIELAPKSRQAELRAGDLGTIADAYALKRLANPARSGSVNGKNAFAPTDAETPLQFLDEPANCRFFYTPEMLSNPDLVWKRTVDATWNDPKKFCVEGSITPVIAKTNEDVAPAFRKIITSGHGALGVGIDAGERFIS